MALHVCHLPGLAVLVAAPCRVLTDTHTGDRTRQSDASTRRALRTRSRGQQGQLTQVPRTRPPDAPARATALSGLQSEERPVGGESSLAGARSPDTGLRTSRVPKSLQWGATNTLKPKGAGERRSAFTNTSSVL